MLSRLKQLYLSYQQLVAFTETSTADFTFLCSMMKCPVRFAGQWERNMHQGFGVYVSPGGRERYVGQWLNSKRHGYGR